MEIWPLRGVVRGESEKRGNSGLATCDKLKASDISHMIRNSPQATPPLRLATTLVISKFLEEKNFITLSE